MKVVEKKGIKIFINDKAHDVEEGLMIMQAADSLGYRIPRLCYHPRLSLEGACRVCIVEVDGMSEFVASCSFPVKDGMKIYTETKRLRQARRDIVELILDNHPKDCHTCERNGNCELQRLSSAMGIKERLFEGEAKEYKPDVSSSAIVRDPNKCILCGRCVRVCSEVQGIYALDFAYKGFKTVVMPAYNLSIAESVCSTCGQCVTVCPTAAFVEKNNAKQLFEKLDDPTVIKIVQVGPSVRAAIGEAFGLEPGLVFEKEIVASLRALGFDYVFDTQFAADLTIMEEASEFLERFQSRKQLPLITSCSSGWIKMIEQFYPEMLPYLSTCKAPMSMMGTLIKTYLAKKLELHPSKIISVAVMPCTAKKYEAHRPELRIDGLPVVDDVITTRELAWMIKSAGIDLLHIKGSSFDAPLGLSSGGGAMFGVTGGVLEASMRTAYELYTGETLLDIEFKETRGLQGIKEGAIEMENRVVKMVVAHGLTNARIVLERIRENPGRYDLVEIMGCPGGCIGGGGQPYSTQNSLPFDEETLLKRAQGLYGIDRSKTIRRSHENPDVQRIYRKFLGRPLSRLAYELLHTQYTPKEPKGLIPREDKND